MLTTEVRTPRMNFTDFQDTDNFQRNYRPWKKCQDFQKL